jgi:hypothetical protein
MKSSPVNQNFGRRWRMKRYINGRSATSLLACTGKFLNFREDPKPSQRAAYKRQVLASLAARQSEQSLNPSQT